MLENAVIIPYQIKQKKMIIINKKHKNANKK